LSNPAFGVGDEDVPTQEAETKISDASEKQPHSAESHNATITAKKSARAIARDDSHYMRKMVKLARSNDATGVNVSLPSGATVQMFFGQTRPTADSGEAGGKYPRARRRLGPPPVIPPEPANNSNWWRNNSSSTPRSQLFQGMRARTSRPAVTTPPAAQVPANVVASPSLLPKPPEPIPVVAEETLRERNVKQLIEVNKVHRSVAEAALDESKDNVEEASASIFDDVAVHEKAEQQRADARRKQEAALDAAAKKTAAAARQQEVSRKREAAAAAAVAAAKMDAVTARQQTAAREREAAMARAQAAAAAAAITRSDAIKAEAKAKLEAAKLKKQPHIDSHVQKKHVGVSVSGQKTREIPKAYRKPPKASADATGSGPSTVT
jgi:hypothetical protein